MLFSNAPRCLYTHPTAHEVICQLRFPTILSIESREPADFQEEIRARFPLYARRQESLPASVFRCTGNTSESRSLETVTNYHFVTEDHLWKLNLTKNFISLSTLRYTGWEDFAAKLDKPLAAFIRIYKPAYFERVGLRYLNFISRFDLGLEGVPFSELISPCYLGPLMEEDISETAASRCSVDAEMAIRGGCRVKLHAGPGMTKQNGQADKEVKFIFDQDLYMPGQLQLNLVAGALQTLHSQADSIFRGAITDKLHEAMDPEIL